MSEQNPFPGYEPQSGGSRSENEQSDSAAHDHGAGGDRGPQSGPASWEYGNGPGTHSHQAPPPSGYQHPNWSWDTAYHHPQGGGPYPGAASQTGPGSVHGPAGPRNRRPATIIAAAFVAGVVGAGTGVGAYALLAGQQQTSSTSSVQVSNSEPASSPKKKGSIEAAAKKIKPSVVTVTQKSGSGKGLGSGVVTDDKGHILTNAHVVAPSQDQESLLPGGFDQSSASKITVTLSSGKTTRAKVVGVDKADDLAVLKADGAKKLTPATFAKSNKLQTGQSVVAVGAPLGLSQTVTNGIVSNTHRPVRSGNKSDDAVYQAIQTDAAINPGNSGGPLVNLNGDVVGINSAIKSANKQSSEGQQVGNIGIGFAIPSHTATRVAGQLTEHGKVRHAALGVTVSGGDAGADASTKTGVKLRSVKSGGAADKAGIEQGDVVTQVDGAKVTTGDGLIAAIRYHAPNDTVKITYHRGGTSHTAKVDLGTS